MTSPRTSTPRTETSAGLTAASKLASSKADQLSYAKLHSSITSHPVILVKTATMLLDEMGSRCTSLRSIGIDPDQLGQAAVNALLTRDFGTADTANLVCALALSGVELSEQVIVEGHLRAHQNAKEHPLQGDLLANFNVEPAPVRDLLRGPSGALWLASPIVDFEDARAWPALRASPGLAAAAISNPEGLLSGSAHRGYDPGTHNITDYPTELFAEYLRRVARIDSPQQALYMLSSWVSSNFMQSPQAAPFRLATVEMAAELMATNADISGQLFGSFAELALAAKDDAFTQALVGIMDNTSIDITSSRSFIFHPSGSGGVTFPDDETVTGKLPDLPSFTWADYTLAYASPTHSNSIARQQLPNDGSEGLTYSASLDYLAGFMRSTGLDQAIEQRGTPRAMLELEDIQTQFTHRMVNRDQAATRIESTLLLLVTSRPHSECSASTKQRI